MNRTALKALAHLRRGGKKAMSGPAAQNYLKTVTPGASRVQQALVDLIGTDGAGTGTFRTNASRMAADPKVLALLQALPAAGAIYGTGTLTADVMDQVFNDDDPQLTDQEQSFANTPMDLLGMGVGAYGMNRGVNRLGGTTSAGRFLATAAGAGLGKLTSDVATGVLG